MTDTLSTQSKPHHWRWGLLAFTSPFMLEREFCRWLRQPKQLLRPQAQGRPPDMLARTIISSLPRRLKGKPVVDEIFAACRPEYVVNLAAQGGCHSLETLTPTWIKPVGL